MDDLSYSSLLDCVEYDYNYDIALESEAPFHVLPVPLSVSSVEEVSQEPEAEDIKEERKDEGPGSESDNDEKDNIDDDGDDEDNEDQDPSTVSILSVCGIRGEFGDIVGTGTHFLPDITSCLWNANVVGENATIDNVELVAKDVLKKALRAQSSKNALVFFAAGLGGTILKKALLIASKDEEYSSILMNTSLLVFFGTPHRASASNPWATMISRFILTQYHGRPGPWLASVTNQLAIYHEDLAVSFDNLLDTHKFDIVNFYQERSALNDFEILIDRFNATLDNDGEIQLGVPRSPTAMLNIYLPEHKELFSAKCKDASTRLRKDYQEFILLLAKRGLHMATRHGIKPVYNNLCDWILSDAALTSWVDKKLPPNEKNLVSETNAPKSPSQKTSVFPEGPSYEGTSRRSQQSVARNLRIIEIEGLVRDPTILASALITSLQRQRRNPTDVFLSLAHHQPCPWPLTRAQLMACLCQQLLSAHPSLFLQIQPLIEDTREAFNGCNSAWIDATLLRCLRELLSGQVLGQVFLLIQEPAETEFSSPFLQLLSDILDLVKATEIQMKVLFVRSVASKSDVQPNTNTTVYVKLKDLISPGSSGSLFRDTEEDYYSLVVRKRLDPKKPDVRDALQADYYACLDLLNQRRTSPISFRDIENVIFDDLRDLQIPQNLFSLLMQYPFLSMQSVIGSPGLKEGQDIITTVLNYAPQAAESMLKTVLFWISNALRPLTCVELTAALMLDLHKMPNGKIDTNVISEFEELLCGLIEVEDYHVYITDCAFLRRLSSEDQKKQDLSNTKGPAFTPSKEIALKCHEYILTHYRQRHGLEPVGKSEDEGTASQAFKTATEDSPIDMDTEKLTLAPLMSYAIEHWFSYLRTLEGPSCEHGEVENGFIADEVLVNYCLRLRVSEGASAATQPIQTNTLSISRMQQQLGIDISQATNLAVRVSELQSILQLPEWPSVAVAACQLGNVEVVQSLDKMGAFEDKLILTRVFKTGCDNCLLALAKTHSDFVAQSSRRILQDAARLGNYGLLEYIMNDPNDILEHRKTLLHSITKFSPSIPPESLWNMLKQDINHVEACGKKRTSLHVAALWGHSNLLSRELMALAESETVKTTVNQQDSTGASPLFLASKYGHFTVVKQLLAAGASHSVYDDKLQGPLHIASYRGYSEIAETLLLHNAVVDAKDRQGKTPVHLALENNHSTIATKLLQGPISNIDSPTSDNLTLISLATRANQTDIVKTLLGRGASIRWKDKNDRDAVQYAAEYGYDEVLRLLLDADAGGIEVDYPSEYSPLWLAARLGNLEPVRMLLNKGFDCNGEGDWSVTAMEVACQEDQTAVIPLFIPYCTRKNLNGSFLAAVLCGNHDIVELLLEAGADINTKSIGDNAALHYGAYNSNAKLVQILAVRRAQIDIPDAAQRTPLHDAARQNSVDCVRILVSACADVDAANDAGETPLYLAAKGGHEKVVAILLAAKCSLNIPACVSQQYSTFLEMAMETFDLDVFRSIVKHIAASEQLKIPPDVLLQFLQGDHCDIEKVDVLLKSGIDPNENIGEYGSMLHYAALWGRLDHVKLLCKFDSINVDAIHENKLHGTPLQVAVYRGNENGPEIVRLLFAHQADTCMGSGYYGSPLSTAAAMPWSRNRYVSEETYLTMAKLILDQDNTTVDKEAGYHGTPIQFAANGDSMKMLHLLLQYSPKLDILAGAFGTPLHLAAFRLHQEMAESLMRKSPSLHRGRYDKCGRLPMHLAVLSRIIQCSNDVGVELFISKETPLLSTDKYQHLHVLHFGAGRGHLNLVKMVVQENPEAVGSKDLDGWTPLHWACRCDDFEVVQFLLDNGAEKNCPTTRGWTPFDVAIHHGGRLIREEKREEILKPDKRDESFQTSSSVELDLECLIPATEETLLDAPNGGRYECDCCRCLAFGTVYECKDCINYQLCFKCYRRKIQIHQSGHSFTRITEDTTKV